MQMNGAGSVKTKTSMTKEEIIEGNKAIAIFMGFVRKQGALNHYSVPKGKELEYKAYTLDLKNMPYHSSWDWLMPVVEKIQTTNVIGHPHHKYHVDISYKWCAISYPAKQGTATQYIYTNMNQEINEKESTINEVWKAVVKFIQWYNTQSHE